MPMPRRRKNKTQPDENAVEKLFRLAEEAQANGTAPTTVGEWEQFIIDAENDGLLPAADNWPIDESQADADLRQYARQLRETGPVPATGDDADDPYDWPTCTCYPDGWNHEEVCDLWYDDEFAHGLARWNPQTEELEPAPDDWTPEVAPPVSQGIHSTAGSKYATTVTTGGKTYEVDDWDTGWRACRHYGVSVTLPDGTVIHPSSLNNPSTRQAGDGEVDLGCYMAEAWNPDWLAYNLPWIDYGLPQVKPELVRHVVVELVKAAQAGLWVEIGCIGGHGRTGTLLALMVAHVSRLTPQECIRWVRTNYCSQAIESTSQMKLIEAMAPFVRANSLHREMPANLIEKCKDAPIRKAAGTTAAGSYPATVGNANGTWVQGHLEWQDDPTTGERKQVWINGHFEPHPITADATGWTPAPAGTTFPSAKDPRLTWVKQEDGTWIQVTSDGCIIETPGATPSNPTGRGTPDAGPLAGTGGSPTPHYDTRDPRSKGIANRATQKARPGAVRMEEGIYMTTRRVDPAKLSGHGPIRLTVFPSEGVQEVHYADGTVATQTRGGATTIDTTGVKL